MAATHDVANQPPPLAPYDAFSTDRALTESLARYGVTADLEGLGKAAGSEQAQEWGRLANAYPPILRTHDRYGNRIDEVEFHPAWHALMDTAVSNGLAGAAWLSTEPDAHTRRAAAYYVWHQAEAGHFCPITMTYAVIPALRADAELAARYETLLASTSYDPGLREPRSKRGLLAGMGMTEKQGGSDVRANTTRAVPQSDGSYLLTGHKWFCSAPMCDLFLILAQVTDAGPTCFLVPRILPDGTRNTFAIQRLKDKLGNRSNASSEVEFDGTVGWRVGPEGRGVPTIIEMVRMTRLDCVIGSASTMRAATSQAIHHATHRSAFGSTLRDKPLMRNVLADLAIEAEAASALMLRLAHAVDANDSEFGRLATAIGKFWVCKRSPVVAAEAMECLGGNGYVEDSGMPRMYRESPLNAIWEGSSNVIALDILRALGRQPQALEAYLEEVDLAAGADPRLDSAVKRLRDQLADDTDPEPRARRLAQQLALCLQGSLLVRHAPAYVADAYCATRLDGDWGYALGMLPSGVDTAAIVDRAAPYE